MATLLPLLLDAAEPHVLHPEVRPQVVGQPQPVRGQLSGHPRPADERHRRTGRGQPPADVAPDATRTVNSDHADKVPKGSALPVSLRRFRRDVLVVSGFVVRRGLARPVAPRELGEADRFHPDGVQRPERENERDQSDREQRQCNGCTHGEPPIRPQAGYLTTGARTRAGVLSPPPSVHGSSPGRGRRPSGPAEGHGRPEGRRPVLTRSGGSRRITPPALRGRRPGVSAAGRAGPVRRTQCPPGGWRPPPRPRRTGRCR